jgi:hypothetical protein
VAGLIKANPAYGGGAYRRRLRMRASNGRVDVELEDSNHAFCLHLQHNCMYVTQVVAETRRYPFVTCAEAVARLQPLVGADLRTDGAALRQRLPQGANCTHLHDMALLALSHAAEVPGFGRLYDIVVKDECDGLTEARIDCDGKPVHVWHIRSDTVAEPLEHAGKPMKRGFYAWVSQNYDGMVLEAAVALQRGYFVAQSRRVARLPYQDWPAGADNMPDGTCYSYNHDVVARALRIEGTVWDLTDKPELLLRFRQRP